MSIETLLSRIQGDDTRPDRDPGGLRGTQLKALRLRLRHEMTVLRDALAKIQQDPTKSPEGKRVAARELAKKIDVSFLDGLRAEAGRDIAQYASQLFALPKSERNETLAFLHEQEVRTAFKDQPPQKVMQAYQTAMEEGRYEIARALTNGPLGSLVDPAFQTRVDEDHARHSQPAVFENFQSATTLKEHLDSLQAHANQALAALTEEPPVRRVA